MYNEYWDWRLGIRASGGHRLASEGIEDEDFHDYSASSYLDLRRALDRLGGIAPDDVFLDLGSGKGGVALMAATHPFRRVVGVEISPRLHSIALSNLWRARSRLRCQDVEFHALDVARYRLPSDISVVFLYNPFGGSTLERVLGEIQRSLAEAPRRLRIICATPDRLIRALAGQDWVAPFAEFTGLRRHVLFAHDRAPSRVGPS